MLSLGATNIFNFEASLKTITVRKTNGTFPNENSLLKLLYIGIQQASEKWTMPVTNLEANTITQLSIYFEGRLNDIIKL